MSICRYSCNDFQCDLYVYESDVGFAVLPAKKRRVFTEPLPPPVPFPTTRNDPGWKAWHERREAVGLMVDAAQMVDIDLPFAGESMHAEDAASCADLIESLIALGYRCPDDVVPLLREMATDSNTKEGA